MTKTTDFANAPDWPPSNATAGGAATLVRLSVMMFLQYAVWGAWAPVLSKHLGDIGFTGVQIGHIYGTMAIASMISPWLAGQLADRLFRAEHVLFASHLFGAAALWLSAMVATPGFGDGGTDEWLERYAAGENRFPVLYYLALAYAILYVPTIGLTNLVAFRHLTDRDRQFGRVRLWGTIGWIASSWALAQWLSKPDWLPSARASMDDCLRLAAILSALLALFSIALPRTPPVLPERSSRFAALAALKLLRRPSFAVLIVVGLLLAIAMQFYYQHSAPFLSSLRVPDDQIGPYLSIGQICEILVLAALPLFIRRWGVKGVFLVGIAAWAARFFVFSAGTPWELVVVSLGLHGFCFAFVFAMGQIYVDRHADADIRASAQSLFAFVTLGVGFYVGSRLAGEARDYFMTTATSQPVTDYSQVFFWPAVTAVACFLLFAAFFRDSTRNED